MGCGVTDERHERHFGCKALDCIKKLGVIGGLDDDLILHFELADKVCDLLGIFPELIDVYKTLTAQELKHIAQAGDAVLRGCKIPVVLIEFFNIRGRMTLDGIVHAKMNIFHAGMLYEKLAVAGLVNIKLDNICACKHRRLERGDGVAGNVTAANAAMSNDKYLLFFCKIKNIHISTSKWEFSCKVYHSDK